MKAVQVTGDKTTHEVTLTQALPVPVLQGNGILIKVRAAGITADELGWPELYETQARIPGHDISGVVEAVGPDYGGPVKVGDSVFAMLNVDAGAGGQAEYVVATPDDALAPKPASLSHAQAAALPIPFLTAWEAVFQQAKLRRGEKVLVTGASGAVGLVLVQLASKLLGAQVVALASPRNHALLREVGAGATIDYDTPGWEDSVRDVDAVFDTVGGSVLAKTWSVVKRDGGVIVTVGDPAPPWAFGKAEPEELRAHPDVKWIYFIVTARGGTLEKLAALVDDGTVRPLPVQVFPVDQALEAWDLAAKRGRKGKVVIDFAAASQA